ncbi:preprotein translocase subunit SecE [Halalkalibacter urbisdiaboli]|uniref:preprotein translocase subunit SecE n=1 Tax=Halalkalibacter urbisdiaboli TaxID=1960589 RepID=UPI001A98802B|nr:preprotein translocase subunit SecE [Halalkalibacter urbisdiaboli]
MAVKNVGKFLGDVVSEMKRVSWPTRKELTRYSWVVLGTVAFITVFFAIVDYVITFLIRLING